MSALSLEEAIELVVAPRNRNRPPGASPWIAVGEPEDHGWAWVFATNLASALDDPLTGMVGQGLSVVAKDGSIVADTGSAPGMRERVEVLRRRWRRDHGAV